MRSTARADVIYGELLGKAGEYGVGYEHPITDTTLARRRRLGRDPARPADRHGRAVRPREICSKRGANGMFLELGAVLAHSRIPSPVMDWSGTSDTGGGGFLSLGYQRTEHWLVMRVAASAVVGEGGVAPAIGFAFGVKP